MPRKNEYGKYILYANEIGAYTVCPEAWRLRAVQHVRAKYSESVERGQALHTAWAKDYDEAIYFARGVKILLALLALAICLFLLT